MRMARDWHGQSDQTFPRTRRRTRYAPLIIEHNKNSSRIICRANSEPSDGGFRDVPTPGATGPLAE